jgi:hypothetical protein
MANSAVRTVLLLLLGVQASAASIIVPEFNETAPHWLDTNGNRIEAHSAGMLQSPKDGRWYWYGETAKTSDLSTHGVSCYSADSIAGACCGLVVPPSICPPARV